MRKVLLFTVFIFIMTSCYKVEIPLFGGTSWEYNGNVIDSNINAKTTKFVFISNDSLEVYENNILSKKFYYEFNHFTRKGYVKKDNFYFERLDESEMEVLFPRSKYIFDRVK